MKWNTGIVLFFCIIILSAGVSAGDSKKSLHFDNFDNLDMRTTDSGMVWYGSGNLKFRIDSTNILADSLAWYQDYDIIYFFGNVEAFDSSQHIWADKIRYYHSDSLMFAEGNVVLVQKKDSIRAEAQFVEYNLRDKAIYMENDPWLYLNYPDYKNIVKITADYLFFYRDEQNGMAIDNVYIKHSGTEATCGCAEMFKLENKLYLMDDPVAVRDSSRISGDFMDIHFGESRIESIQVFSNAKASFVEESNTSTGEFSGKSNLSGESISFYFKDDQVRKIAATGAAQSEYYPGADDSTGAGKNFVSGDTIYIYVENRKIIKAEVIGGAEGVYITENTSTQNNSKQSKADSVKADSDSPCDTCQAVLMTEQQFKERYNASDTSLSADSAVVSDTLLVEAEEPSFAEDSILYKGQLLEFFAPERIIRVTGNSEIHQKQVELKAHSVDYDIPNRIIIARAKIDSTDSIPDITPLMLKDGGEEIFGTRLVFNVDTKKGLIEDAATLFEKTRYRGEDLFKEDDKVFYVENGVLIPCDKENPNFHFHAKRMKVIKDERVIARPVTLYIHKLPVMYLPYYVFPLQRGRHSGILPIKLGNFEKGNRFIGNLGYYWAASEYWDLEGALDFYENIGITINGLLRYNKRYAYTGYVRATYARENEEYVTSESVTRRWSLSGSHSQTLPYDIKFGASGNFVSDKSYYTDYSNDINDRRNRNVTSKANFSKSLGWGSISLNFEHVNNLDTDSKSSSLPSGRFSIKSFRPFGSGEKIDGKLFESWYNRINIGYSNNFLVKTLSSKSTEINTETYMDPVGEEVTVTDTVVTNNNKKYQYLNHSMSISASQKLFTYFDINESVSGQETWYFLPFTNMLDDAGIPGNRAYRRGSVSARFGAKTNLYGTFNINVKGLQAIRHIFTPSISMNWAPLVSKNAAVKSYAGIGGGGGRQLTLGMSVSNNIQASIKKGDKEQKLDVLRVSTSTGYNFEATGKKFSSLSTRISSSILKNISLSGSLAHSMYDNNDKLIWWRPQLQSFSVNSSFQLRGSVSDDYTRTGLDSERDYQKELLQDSLSQFPSPTLPGEKQSQQASGNKINWNMNVSHNYSETYNNGRISSKSHFSQITFNVNITNKWKLKYSHRYDFVRHETIDKIIDLHRQMNCWEGHFYWIPNGSRRGFYFKIFLLAIPDLKVEKSESGLRGALFNR